MTQKTLDTYQIREAQEKDVHAIVEIYNERVLHSVHVFTCVPVTFQSKLEWFRDMKSRGYPIIVAVEKETDKTVGYVDLARYKDDAAYSLTAEISLFIHSDHRQRGLGRLLLSEILGISNDMRIRSIIAVVVTENEPSIKLFFKLGFKKAAELKEVGFKFGRHLGVTFLEHTSETCPAILKPNPSFTPFPWGSYSYQPN